MILGFIAQHCCHHRFRSAKTIGLLLAALCMSWSCRKKPSSVKKDSRLRHEVQADLLRPPTVGQGSVAPRVVAIGDLHGDLRATQAVLRLAGLMDDKGHWAGGKTVFVQTGDVLDRGDDEPEILALLWRLQEEAPRSGGRVELLLGNHEVMNASGDLRYVTPGGFSDYQQSPIPSHWPRSKEITDRLPAGYLGRKAAFAPGSAIASRFAEQKVVLVVGSSVFVHGGLDPKSAAKGIETLNRETSAWLRGQGSFPSFLKGARGPIWNRDYGAEPDARDCATLAASLRELGVKRMVVGHTVHPEGINSACDGQVWRIDVGMARHYGGRPQALEIIGDEVRIIR